MGSYYGYTPTLIHAGVGSIIARGAEVVANITMEGAKAIAGVKIEGAKTQAGMKLEGAKSRAGIIMSSAASQAASLIEGAKMRLDYSKFQQQLAENKRQHAAEMSFKYASLASEERRAANALAAQKAASSRSSGSPVSGGGGGGVRGGLDGTNFVPPDDPYPSDIAAVNPFAESPGEQARMDIVPDMGTVSKPGEGELVVFRPDGSDRSGTGYITRADGTGVYIDDTTRATEDRIGTFTADNAPEWAPPRTTQDNTFVGPLPDDTTPN